ncbi:protein unc-80 homolog [Clytia hemisphaerica]
MSTKATKLQFLMSTLRHNLFVALETRSIKEFSVISGGKWSVKSFKTIWILTSAKKIPQSAPPLVNEGFLLLVTRSTRSVDAILLEGFINSLLGHLSTMHHFGEDAIGIFLEPINGALLLHCEDVMILRSSIAALINVAREYGKKFSNDGYFDVLPTIFKVYSQHENNMLVKEVLEFAIAQFYNLHRSPFLLQMFASVSPMLMTDDMIDLTPEELYELIPSRCLFALLESLDHEIEDRLDIMSLVDGEKPIRPYDDVLEDNDHNKIDLSIRLALTIIAYKPESSRALQMMFVLSAIVPYHLKYLESQTDANPHESDHKKHEMRQIKSLIKYIATIIEHNEALVIRYRNDSSMNADNLLDNPSSSGILDRMQSAYTAVRNWWRNAGEMIQEGDEPEHIFEDGENPLLVNATNRDEKKQLDDFYQPRTVLLTLASEFTLQCTQRYSQLKSNTRGQNDTKFSDIIDEENAFILIDVAMSLLQLVFYDHNVLKNAGLQRFLLEAMPSITWTESLEAFTIIIKRMNRIFNKLLLKPAYMSFVDWDGLEVLIKGVNLTVKKDESVADVEDLRSLLHTCTRVMIGDFSTQLDPSAPTSSTADIPDGLRSPSSPGFNTMVIKLAAKLLYIRNDQFGLESNMMMYLQDPDATKVERFLIHWLLPLCIRMGTGRYDMPTLSTDDVTFVSNVLMNLLQLKNADGSTHVANQAFSMLTSFTFNFGRQHQTISPAMSQICFLGLKILLNVFNEAFGKLWKSLRSALIHYIDFNESDYTVWLFISHIVSNRSPVLMHLIPVIRKKLADISRYPFRIQQLCQRIKKDFANPPVMGSRSQVLDHLLVELSSLAKGEVRTLDDNTVKEGEIDETDFKLSNTPVRRVSQEEDDESYIKRVKTERERAWKSGRRDTKKSRVSPKGSIMKRRQTKTSDASPKEKERLRKTVSFKPSKTSLDEDDTDITMEETTQEVPTNFQSSPTRNLSSPRRKIGKLSKRTKHMKMFRRQDSTDCSDDDEKSIIPNDDDRAARSSPPRHLHDDHELSDDSQGKLVKSSSSSTASSENNDDKKDGGGGGRFCEEGIFNESITSPKNGERYTLSVSSSIDSNDGFKERPRCFSHNPSLSRSPAVKRRNERPSLKIAGLATMSTQRLSSLSRDRFSSAKGDERQSIDEGDENSTRQGNSLSPPALSPESALPPALDLSAVTTEFPEERNNTLSPTSIHSSSSGLSSPQSPRRKLSPSLQPFVNFFDDPNGQKPAVALPEDDATPSTALSPPLIERDPLPSVMPLEPVVVPVTLPPTKMKSPSQQKRSLPKPPAFDEESIAKIHKKLSLEMQKPQP